MKWLTINTYVYNIQINKKEMLRENWFFNQKKNLVLRMVICVLDLHKVLLIVEVQMSVVDKSQHGTWVKFKNPKPYSNSNIG